MEMQMTQPRFLVLPDTPVPTLEYLYSFDQWLDYGRQLKDYETRLGEYTKAFQLLIGDWVNYGVTHWQRPAEREIKKLGFSRETADNFAWVARRIPASLRNDDYTFEDYRTVAALPEETERAEWLEKKKANDWSGRELRRQIATALGKPVPAASQTEKIVNAHNCIGQLIDALCAEGAALLAKPDAISRAQGDVKLDCAARLRETMK